MFLRFPTRLHPGGITGLATAINALTGIPIGTFFSLINIPLLLLGLKFLGKDFIIKTLISTILFTAMVDVLFVYIPPYTGDMLLAALFGGAMIGAGMAITFIRNGSTGGTDITSRVIQSKFPQFPIGKIVLLSDLIIISFATLVFANLESALYAIIAMFVCSKVIDSIIYGLDVGKWCLSFRITALQFPRQLLKKFTGRYYSSGKRRFFRRSPRGTSLRDPQSSVL